MYKDAGVDAQPSARGIGNQITAYAERVDIHICSLCIQGPPCVPDGRLCGEGR
jgi:hypothetical protein